VKGFAMSVIVFVHALLFLVFWLTNLSFQQSVNTFLSDTTGLRMNFLLIFLFFAAVVFVWSMVRLDLLKKFKKTGRDWLYNAIGSFFLVFFYGSFIVLFLKNPVQWARLGQFILYFRIVFDIVMLCLAAWGLRILLAKLDQRWQKRILILAFLLFWLVPVFWNPGSVYRGQLPEKPLLIAHRGASMLAPENTLASMQMAADLGVYGVETDITISWDGIPFLMHDSTLERTTDVAQVFPGREKDKAESYSWNELTHLDAGEWFFGQDLFPGEPIPSLAETLEIVQENDLYFIYDLRIPSGDHPYKEAALDLILAEVKTSGIGSRTWVLASLAEIPVVRAVLPQAILAKSLDYRHATTLQELIDAGYQVINSEFGLSNRSIHAYQNAGLWVNLWTVDEPWQYSRLWLAHANSVTSNNSQSFVAMLRPVLAIPYRVYLVIWGVVGVVAAGLGSGRLRREN
jgi:glycerophosphoryl diester phosphodiesterase